MNQVIDIVDVTIPFPRGWPHPFGMQEKPVFGWFLGFHDDGWGRFDTQRIMNRALQCVENAWNTFPTCSTLYSCASLMTE